MAIFKPLTRYAATPVPLQTSRELRGWLTKELDFISLGLNGIIDFLELPRQFLYGPADTVNVDLVAVQITGYESAAVRGRAELPDNVAGTITIPETGLYTGTAYVYGLQASAFQNQEIHLLVQFNNDTPMVFATFDVASNQTNDRVLNATVTGQIQAGDVMSLWINATADLGTFQILRTTFQFERVR